MTPVQRINGALRRVPAWPIYPVFTLWVLWDFWRAASGAWIDPVARLEHEVGLLALQLLIATLAVTPIRRMTGITLIRFRRALGVMVFVLALFHLTVWWVLDVQSTARVATDILKRPYITFGMAAFVLLVPLAATSSNLAIRKMGPLAWRRLHRLAYPAAILAGIHFVWLRKGWQPEPLIYLAVIAGLLLMRIDWPRVALRTRMQD